MTLTRPSLSQAAYQFLDRQQRGSRLLIGGAWVEAGGGEPIATLDPATGETLALIDQRIYELSKNSKFFQNEERKVYYIYRRLRMKLSNLCRAKRPRSASKRCASNI